MLLTDDEIIVQNESTEAANYNEKHCDGQAEVVEDSVHSPTHVISDSLVGASNSYNVIPARNAKSQFEVIQNQILAAAGAINYRSYLTYSSTDSNAPTLIDISFKT